MAIIAADDPLLVRRRRERRDRAGVRHSGAARPDRAAADGAGSGGGGAPATAGEQICVTRASPTCVRRAGPADGADSSARGRQLRPLRRRRARDVPRRARHRRRAGDGPASGAARRGPAARALVRPGARAAPHRTVRRRDSPAPHHRDRAEPARAASGARLAGTASVRRSGDERPQRGGRERACSRRRDSAHALDALRLRRCPARRSALRRGGVRQRARSEQRAAGRARPAERTRPQPRLRTLPRLAVEHTLAALRRHEPRAHRGAHAGGRCRRRARQRQHWALLRWTPDIRLVAQALQRRYGVHVIVDPPSIESGSLERFADRLRTGLPRRSVAAAAATIPRSSWSSDSRT